MLKTLVYLSTHHYAVAENLLHSPLAPRKIHRLTNKQFTWATLRAKVEAWTDCENLVVGKGCRVEVSIWIVKKRGYWVIIFCSGLGSYNKRMYVEGRDQVPGSGHQVVGGGADTAAWNYQASQGHLLGSTRDVKMG